MTTRSFTLEELVVQYRPFAIRLNWEGGLLTNMTLSSVDEAGQEYTHVFRREENLVGPARWTMWLSRPLT